MIKEIVIDGIFGISIVNILGIIAYVLFIFTALISIASARGIRFINFKWHPRIAVIALLFATAHALLVIIKYL